MNFTISVTLLGYVVAAHTSMLSFNLFKLTLLIFANIFAVAFAFVINELEDAEDDGKKINITLARNLSIITFIISFLLYLLLGKLTFIFGFSILVLGFLYSWKKVRLKGYPIVDILSHCLMLGGLIFLPGYFSQGQFLGKAIF